MTVSNLTVERYVSRARALLMGHVVAQERRFIESTVERGALSLYEANLVLSQERPGVLAAIEHEMLRVREWIKSELGEAANPASGEIGVTSAAPV